MAPSTPVQPTSTKKRSADAESEQPRPAKRIRVFLKKAPKSAAPARTITVAKIRTAEMQPWLQGPGYDNTALLNRRLSPQATNGPSTSGIAHGEHGTKGHSHRVETVLKHEVLRAQEGKLSALRKREMEFGHFVKKIARECFPARGERVQRDALRVLIGWFGRSGEGDGEDE